MSFQCVEPFSNIYKCLTDAVGILLKLTTKIGELLHETALESVNKFISRMERGLALLLFFLRHLYSK